MGYLTFLFMWSRKIHNWSYSKVVRARSHYKTYQNKKMFILEKTINTNLYCQYISYNVKIGNTMVNVVIDFNNKINVSWPALQHELICMMLLDNFCMQHMHHHLTLADQRNNSKTEKNRNMYHESYGTCRLASSTYQNVMVSFS